MTEKSSHRVREVRAVPKTAQLAVSIMLALSGCQHIDYPGRDIVLDGFSDRNYASLNSNLGAGVCISGAVVIDSVHRNVYFQLEPHEEGGVITIGVSRVISGLSIEYARRRNMIDGRHYRVCGTLRDATPVRQCDHDRCKWYTLENAELG